MRSAVSQIGGAYYGPQGNRCVKSDRENAERYKQLRQGTTAVIMTKGLINEILGAMAPKVLKLLKDGSSRSAPLTLRNVCELGGLAQKDESWVQQSLLHLIRTDKHVHRYREGRSRYIKGAQAYKYWYDIQTTNAEFGSVAKKRKPKKLFDVPASLPIPAPAARAVQVDLMEFNLNSGTVVRLSVADINDLHKRLKLIFG